MSTEVVLCQHAEVHPGVWVCPVCTHKAVTSAAPKNRKCGLRTPKPVHKDVNRQPKEPSTDPGPCVHRGALLREQGCKPCQSSTGKALVEVFACAKHGECTLNNTGIQPKIKGCSTCADKRTFATIEKGPFCVIPTQGGPEAWRGVSEPRPWEYDVTAIIPVINPDPSFALAIELLRLQTERPYIQVLDTGSCPKTVEWLESMRAADLEVHYVKKHGVIHASELVSMALDVGNAVSLSRFSFFTHSDVFLRKRTALQELKAIALTTPVVGHQLTERPYEGWQREVGHTLLMVDQFRMRELGIHWNMQHWGRQLGLSDYNVKNVAPNFVDTERGFNAAIQHAGITPHFTGTEANYQRNTDEWIDHVRSLAGSLIYSAEYQAKAQQWLQDAQREAAERIEQWKSAT